MENFTFCAAKIVFITAFSNQLFFQKASFHMFDRALNMPSTLTRSKASLHLFTMKLF